MIALWLFALVTQTVSMKPWNLTTLKGYIVYASTFSDNSHLPRQWTVHRLSDLEIIHRLVDSILRIDLYMHTCVHIETDDHNRNSRGEPWSVITCASMLILVAFISPRLDLGLNCVYL